MNIRYGFGIRDTANQVLRRNYVRLNTRQLSGPRAFDLEDDEIALVLLGRDVRYFLPVFFDHYRKLGIERFIYLDNGSRDGSAEFAMRQSDAIAARCDLNFRNFQRELRYVAANDFAKGGWRLTVDADELLDYLGSSHVPLPELAKRLSKRGHTGVVAQMLEMVPNGTLRSHSGLDFGSSIASFQHFSTRNITDSNYHDPMSPLRFHLSFNSISHLGIKMKTGGIRRTLFGEDCMLTKHVLYRAGPNVQALPHPHVSCGLHCTDFSALLRHYKFAGQFIQREETRRKEQRLSHSEGALRLQVIEETGDVSFSVPGLQDDSSPEALVDKGFLFASDAAREMLAC